MKPRTAKMSPSGWSKIFAVVLTCVISSTVSGDETRATDNESVAGMMRQLAGDVQSLMPLMYRADNSVNLNEIRMIQQTVVNMQDHLGSVGKILTPRSGTYQASFEILTEQLGQAKAQLEKGRVEYGIDLLRSAVSVCASCHTQDDRGAKWLDPTGDMMSDKYVAGEYFFMTRQYQQSSETFQSWLNDQSPLPYEKRTLTAFQRLLITTLQLRQSPDDIKRVLDGYIHRDDIDFMLRTHLVAWRDGVEELQSLTDITDHPHPDRLRQLAEDWTNTSKNYRLAHVYLPENSRPKIVWLRSELYRALHNETDHTLIPQWLYWLAVSDRLLEYRYFYSLADMYLKQCMLDYSDESVARLCYDEYANYVEFFYSGSGGTFIPDDLKSELEMLKSRVYKK